MKPARPTSHRARGDDGSPRLLVVNPSPDQYGADLQMLEAVRAAVEHGWDVSVVLPEDGPLVPRVRDAGAEIVFARYPVLRKASLRPAALVRTAFEVARSLPGSVGLVRRLGIDLVLVNTATLPWWLLAGRLAGRPTVGYLHEAETEGSRWVRRALMLPFGVADRIIVISRSAMTAMTDVAPWLAGRSVLVYNGVPGPAEPPEPPVLGQGPLHLVVAGRLSPRKGTETALQATALLRQRGVDARLDVAGTAFSGYEWFEDRLRDLAREPALAGAVTFSGYCSPIWPVLERADVVLAPSLQEPFGNVVVEAQLAARLVVAASALGHRESVVHGRTGMLVPPGDASAMADAVQLAVAEPEGVRSIGSEARSEALRRFSVERYRREIADVLSRGLA